MNEREALKQALEALEDYRFAAGFDRPLAQDAIDDLRAALAEQPAQPKINCKHRRENNGVCPHHNLHCGWPKCNEPEQSVQQQEQKLEFVSPGGGYVPAIPKPMPLDWKLVPRKATPEMLKAMDECAQEGYDERLYAGMASSVYMAAWDASPVMGTLPEQPAPPPECQTEAEKTAFAFGWWKALESVRQPAQQQEPVSLEDSLKESKVCCGDYANCHRACTPRGRWEALRLVETAQPSKPWVGLTDEEVEDIWNRYCDEMGEASINDALDIARAIERAHGIGEQHE